MKYCVEVRRSPTGELVPNAGVRVRKVSDGTTITTLTADSDGLVTYQDDGHPEAFYLQTTQTTGSPRFWSSRDHITSGALSPSEIPIALTVLGNSVIRGYANALSATLDTTTVTMSTGGALVYGYPIINYAQDIFTFTRPVTSTRIDRIIARVYPYGSATTEGKAEFVVLAGVEGGSAPSLTNSSTVQEATLWRVTVPTAGALTLTDERTFAGETPPVAAITRSAAETTTNASGEILANLNTSLILPRTGTYDVEAWVSCIHDNAVGWVQQATYGSFGAGTSPNFSSPGQLGKDSSSNIFVLDLGNARVVKLNSSGAYVTQQGIVGARGVAVDPSDNVYISDNAGEIFQFDNTFLGGWSIGGLSALGHLATDSTHLYAVAPAASLIYKRLLSTGGAVTSWGSAGSGNGQLSAPTGITVTGSEVYVVDGGNNRVQVFNLTGTYQRQWTVPAGCRGIYPDASGDLFVACYTGNTVYHYTNTGTLIDVFTQATADGIAVTTGDVVWVSSSGGHAIAKWDEAAAGYGGLAIEIDGNLSSYITLGDIKAMLQNSHTRTATGPATIAVKVYGKATSGTATFRSVVLTARAVPRN